ncbi:MAG: outer membrane protein assembly factor BamD [Calditrichia bacterium]
MSIKFFKSFILLLLTVVIFAGCGSKIKKEILDANEYFEYAKGLYDKGKYLDAITEFTVIVLKFSADPVVDDAQFYLAQSHFKNEEYLIAVSEYQKVITDYPESPYVEQAFYQIGLSYSELSQRYQLDQEYTLKALRQFQNLIEAYPDGQYREDAEKQLTDLRKKLAKKQLLGGNVYRKMGIYDSAIIYYDILLEKYYDTPSAEEALYWKSVSLFKMKNYNDALTNFTAFLEKYPKSKHAEEARTKISEIQDKKLNAFNEAEVNN